MRRWLAVARAAIFASSREAPNRQGWRRSNLHCHPAHPLALAATSGGAQAHFIGASRSRATCATLCAGTIMSLHPRPSRCSATR